MWTEESMKIKIKFKWCHTDFEFDPFWLDWEKLTPQPIWFNLYLYLPSVEIFLII